jgi:hypothetical protein
MPNLTDRLLWEGTDPQETPDRAASSSHAGSFTAWERLSFAPSGAAARLYATDDSSYIEYNVRVGAPALSDVVTGQDSGATATLGTITLGGYPFRIGAHSFMAAMGELKRGQITQAQIISQLGLDASAQTDLQALVDHVSGLPNNQSRENYRMELHDVLLLAGAGWAYTTRSALRTRLGI